VPTTGLVVSSPAVPSTPQSQSSTQTDVPPLTTQAANAT
jgi:hypothetical protein